MFFLSPVELFIHLDCLSVKVWDIGRRDVGVLCNIIRWIEYGWSGDSKDIQSYESCSVKSIKLNFLRIRLPESSALCVRFNNLDFSDAMDQILIVEQFSG